MDVLDNKRDVACRTVKRLDKIVLILPQPDLKRPAAATYGATYSDVRDVLDWIINGDFEKLKQTIEQAAYTWAASAANPQPVHLIGLSQGTRFWKMFLQIYVSENWKRRFVANLAQISPVMRGSPEVLISALTNDLGSFGCGQGAEDQCMIPGQSHSFGGFFPKLYRASYVTLGESLVRRVMGLYLSETRTSPGFMGLAPNPRELATPEPAVPFAGGSPVVQPVQPSGHLANVMETNRYTGGNVVASDKSILVSRVNSQGGILLTEFGQNPGVLFSSVPSSTVGPITGIRGIDGGPGIVCVIGSNWMTPQKFDLKDSHMCLSEEEAEQMGLIFQGEGVGFLLSWRNCSLRRSFTKFKIIVPY